MRALQIAATGMAAQQTKVEVISQNLANMSTTAYNARRAEFADLAYQQLTRPGTIAAADGAEPAPDAVVRQGFLEESNVNPVLEIARMIEVQRAYELGQSFLDGEDQRIRAAIAATTR